MRISFFIYAPSNRNKTLKQGLGVCVCPSVIFHFCFSAPCLFTTPLNLRPLVLGLTLFGWVISIYSSNFSYGNIIFDSWVKRDQLDVTCFMISLLNAQHVSDVSTSILRSLRLMCWVISWVLLLWFDVCWCYVVVWLWWCGIRMQAEALVPQPAYEYSLLILIFTPKKCTVFVKCRS